MLNTTVKNLYNLIIIMKSLTAMILDHTKNMKSAIVTDYKYT